MEKGESRSYFERIRSHFRRRKVEYIIGGTLLGFSIGGIKDGIRICRKDN